MQKWCIHFSTNTKQNVNVISTSIISYNLIINLCSSYNHKKIRYKIREWYEFTKLFKVFRVPKGYLRVRIFTRTLPAGNPYPYMQVKFHTCTLTRRVGYPLVKLTSLSVPSLSIEHPSSDAISAFRIQS